MSTGTVIRRGRRSWRLKFDLQRGDDGARRIAYKTVAGARKDAEKELRRLLTSIDRGMGVDPSVVTVAEFLASWLDAVAPATAGAKSLERYRSLARLQIVPYLGHIQLQKLRPADVAGWHQALGRTALSVKSIRHAHGVLRTALAHAAKIEIVERNVATVIKPPTAARAEVEILNAEQIAGVLAKLKSHSIFPIVCLALGTGGRRGELMALRWSDLDLDAATVKIERSLEQVKGSICVKAPKTAAGRRTVSLPAFAVEALRDHRRQALELRFAVGAGALPADAPIFGDIDGSWPSPHIITLRWRAAVTRLGLPKITFHALRHSHASALIAAGLDVVSVSKRLGHASPALTLSVYAHLFENKDDEAAGVMDAVLAQL